MAEPADPNERLALHLGVAPAVLAAKFKELGLRVVDIADTRFVPTDDAAAKTAGKAFEQRIRESAG